jgi:hypothetical protein
MAATFQGAGARSCWSIMVLETPFDCEADVGVGRLDHDRVCSSALSRLRFLRLRLRASADLRRFFWPGFR